MSLINAYIYPLSSRLKGQVNNPYIDNFIKSLNEIKIDCVNRTSPSNKGIIDILKYIRNLDLVFFHWPENIPDKKFGILQTLLVMVLLHLRKLLGVKVIWTLHNKESHLTKNSRWKKMIYRQFIKRADIILTHSEDGIAFLSNKRRIKNCFYIPHPCPPMYSLIERSKEIDILLWGSVAPYKGIDSFLEFVSGNLIDYKPKILIAGKIKDSDYKLKIEKYQTSSTVIIDKIIPQQELIELFSKSRTILFTYKHRSVLSSGALMDSLPSGVRILGPNMGAFKDLEKEGIVDTYQSYSEIFEKIKSNFDEDKRLKKIKTFIEQNTWEKFSFKLATILNI